MRGGGVCVDSGSLYGSPFDVFAREISSIANVYYTQTIPVGQQSKHQPLSVELTPVIHFVPFVPILSQNVSNDAGPSG